MLDLVSKAVSPRTNSDFNFGWQFTLSPVGDDSTDEQWRPIRLPHDWSIESETCQEKGGNATAYLPGGIGHYKKTFSLPESAKGKTTRIEFDGVYSKSDVWINGHHLGHHPYGYSPFSYDLSDHLNFGDDASNEILVRVDRSAYIDCRWYSGSGIYRNVRLVTTQPVSIAQHGTYITTPNITDQQARVSVETQVQNPTDSASTLQLTQTAIAPDGTEIASVSQTITVQPGQSRTEQQFLLVENPLRWDIETPHLYEIRTSLTDTATLEERDQTTTPFGIRTFSYDSKTGFFLNGRNVKFKGVCLHHDAGAVGAAVPIDVWKRRLLKLQEAGVNAIRTAHNPPSSEFLDLCDSMGFLVQDEAFDEWNHAKDKRKNYKQKSADEETRGYTESFEEHSDRDLAAMVLRDRNHPSIVMWSIGNEIEWTYPAQQHAAGYWESDANLDPNGQELDYYWDVPPYTPEEILERYQNQDLGPHNIGSVAKRLADGVRAIDRTRPVTANLVIPSLGMLSGFSDALDIVGTSYRQILTDYLHENYPDTVFIGTENWTQWHEWEWCIDRPYAPGVFLWTGIRYLGESGGWPSRGGTSGLLDFAGQDLPAWHHFKSFWNLSEPHLHLEVVPQDGQDFELDGLGHQADHANPYEILENGSVVRRDRDNKHKMKWGWHGSHRHWNFESGQSLVIEAITNCVSVELLLNEKSIGVRNLSDIPKGNEGYMLHWHIPAFEEGILEARGTTASGKVITQILQTAAKASRLKISADRSSITADRYSTVHFELEIQDANGLPIRHQDREVTFEIEGPLRVLGIDNGSIDVQTRYNVPTVKTHQGRCVFFAQSLDQTGTAKVTAKAFGLESNPISIQLT